MGQILANWDESDGSPYEYHLDLPAFQVKEPTWKYVPYEERNFLYDGSKKKLKSLEVGNLSLWTLHLIDNVEITTLIHNLSDECSAYIEIEEDMLSAPLNVYLDYPFSKVVVAEIPPLSVYHYNGEYHPYFPVGYLFWQVAKVYADIYKNHWEEAGVWGHGLSDLIANGCVIYEDYTVRVDLSS